DFGRALGEQYFRLEDETVADHEDIGTLAEDLAQASEEFRAIARQLLDPLSQRRIESLAEIDDLRLVGARARFGVGQETGQGGDLPTQCRKLLIEQFDLGESIR